MFQGKLEPGLAKKSRPVYHYFFVEPPEIIRQHQKTSPKKIFDFKLKGIENSTALLFIEMQLKVI